MHKSEIAVVGAGIVGVCCALQLQSNGYQVTLYDSREPGTATSYGNAGIIADSLIMPYSVPGLWKKLPAMILSPDSPLKIRWAYLHRALPWVARFLAEGTEKRALEVASEIASLGKRSQSAHRHLMRQHNIDASLIRSNGVLKAYRDATLIENNKFEHECLAQNGVPLEVLNSDELRQLEPGISHEFTAGEFLPEMGQVVQSIRLTEAYYDVFCQLGGRHKRESVRDFEVGLDGPNRVHTDLGIYPVEQVLIAAGAWSRPFARVLGGDVPLDTERGYHINVNWTDEVILHRPVVDAERYYVMAPMTDGVRITTGTELGGLHLKPDFSRPRRILAQARNSLSGLTGEVNREWMGYRPSIPDSKPIIGRSPKFNNVFFAFGHGHLGLTQAAITAELITQIVTNSPPSIDVGPFSIERFF